MEDVVFANDPFFTEADFCLPIVHPSCLVPVQNQGTTHCCYAFVAVSCMHVDTSVNTGTGYRGSEQELMDCLHHKFAPKCQMQIKPPDSGYPNTLTNAFQYIAYHGLSLFKDYPWRGKCSESCCRQNSIGDSMLNIHSFSRLAIEDVVETLNSNKAVGCGIVLTKTFVDWNGDGIYQITQVEKDFMENEKRLGNKLLKHAILVIGYGQKNGVDYFIIQNTYGTGWGYKGFAKVGRECLSLFACVEGTNLLKVKKRNI